MKNGALLISVVWFAQCMPEWPVEIEHAWGFHHRSQFSYLSKRNCCHSASLDFACQQSHGPRTDRSGRYQDHEIDTRLSKERANLASWRQEIFRIVDKAKTVVDTDNTTNGAFCF